MEENLQRYIKGKIRDGKKITKDSLKKRYIYKLITNFVNLFVRFFSALIIPRSLGPSVYGNLSYLTNFFTQITSSLDSATSTAFYTKLSQRNKDYSLVAFYLRFMGIITFLIVIFVLIIHFSSTYKIVFPGQSINFIYLALILVMLTWFLQLLTKMVDAYGLTVSGEKLRIIQSIIGLLVLGALFFFKKINLANIFYYNYFILALIFFGFIWIIHNKGYLLRNYLILSLQQTKTLLKEFFHYCHPLVAYSLLGMIVGIADRWLLQYFSGSIQQGFFGLSFRITSICILFTSALTPLLMREFSISFNENNIKNIALLFRRYIPLMYSLTAFIICFLVFQVDKVIYIIGGSDYGGAFIPLLIMLFYPIHQTYGQLSGSVFFATGHTKLYSKIAIVFMLIGLLFTYILIAPSEKYGLNMGATGLAIKMVVLNILIVNTQLIFNARLLKIVFWKYLAHQIISLLILIFLSLFSSIIVNNVLLFKNMFLMFLLLGLFIVYLFLLL